MKLNPWKLVVGFALFWLLLLAPTFASSAMATTDTIMLSKDNVVMFNGAVNGDSVAEVIRKVQDLNAQGENASTVRRFVRRIMPDNRPIYIFLYTPGGDIQMGLELIEALKGSNRPIHTITLFAASMGFQIVQQLNNRYILSNGVLMSHHAKGGVQGDFGGKGVSQLQARIGLWERRVLDLDEQTVRRTNGKQTLESYQTAYDHELWSTGVEAVAQGYADKVIVAKCDSTLNGTAKKAYREFGMEFHYELSNCPLNTTPIATRASLTTTEGMLDYDDFLERGGEFGTACMQALGRDDKKVCALDTKLTPELVLDAVAKFKDRFTNIQNHVIPMTY